MIKQKKATDKALYERYKDVGPDDPMYPLVKWHEAGQKGSRKRDIYPYHANLAERIRSRHGKPTARFLHETYGLNYTMWVDILNGGWRRVPEKQIREALKAFATEQKRSPAEVTQEEYEKCVEAVRDWDEAITKLAKIWNITAHYLYRLRKDDYQSPPDICKKILRQL